MIKQKGKIIMAGIALFLWIGSLAIVVFLDLGVLHLSNEETLELSSTISYVDIHSTTESTYVRIDTESPPLILYVPPYVIEYLDPDLFHSFVPGSIITFRIPKKDQDYVLSGNPAMICSLSIHENSVFTLSEHNAYMNRYDQPMKITATVVCSVSFCVFVCCLVSMLRIGYAQGSRIYL